MQKFVLKEKKNFEQMLYCSTTTLVIVIRGKQTNQTRIITVSHNVFWRLPLLKKGWKVPDMDFLLKLLSEGFLLRQRKKSVIKEEKKKKRICSAKEDSSSQVTLRGFLYIFMLDNA